jgi:hypothetical protein
MIVRSRAGLMLPIGDSLPQKTWRAGWRSGRALAQALP